MNIRSASLELKVTAKKRTPSVQRGRRMYVYELVCAFDFVDMLRYYIYISYLWQCAMCRFKYTFYGVALFYSFWFDDVLYHILY